MIRTFLVLIILHVFGRSTGTVSRPRGVPLSMVSLYPTEGTFSCLDGSLTIPFEWINDDYCDCEGDGSDEPGTSACPQGNFYCNNVGHKPTFIPSSRVNDGICDCCDGSDEYAVWNVTCENNCFELGQAAREEEARLVTMFKEGSKLRIDLTIKGKQIKREKQLRLLELMKEQTEAELLKIEKESLKNEVEEREKQALDVFKQFEEEKRKLKEEEERIIDENKALEYFREIDKNKDGNINRDEVAKVALFDRNRDGDISEEEISIIFADEHQLSFNSFYENSWKNVKELFVLQQMNENMHKEESNEDLGSDFEKNKIEEGQSEEDDEEEMEEDKELNKEAEHIDDEEKYDDKSSDAVAEETKAEYDAATLKIIEEANNLRSEYENAARNLRDVQREIKQIEETLNKDYGKDDEFGYLVGECYEYTDREYIYKLCPFDQVSQRPKDGGIETRLGTWGHWLDDKYEIMHFGNGQSCWNGPERLTNVKLKCGLQTEVISASEPSRCEYLLELNTPAVCLFNETAETPDLHDEL